MAISYYGTAVYGQSVYGGADEGPEAVPPPVGETGYSWILCAANGERIIEITRSVGSRNLSFKRNGVAEARINLSHESDEGYAVLEALADGIPILEIWRRPAPGELAVRRFSGYLAPFQEDAQDESTMALVFHDPFGRLLGDGENRGTFLDADLTYTAVDAGQIAAALVSEANSQGFTGLVPVGVIEQTVPRDRTYENHAKIGDLIVALTQVIGGFDFEVKPFLLPAEFYLDRFDTDTMSDYGADTGGGSISITAGQVVPSTLTEKRLYRIADPQTFSDVQLTIAWTPSVTLAGPSSSVGLIARRKSGSTYVLAQVSTATGNLDVFLSNNNAVSSPVASAKVPTLVLGATYWLRFRLQGNLLTAEHWTSPPPATGGSPSASSTVRLAGATAAFLGSGITGGVGFKMFPANTNWRMDNFEIRGYGPAIGQFNVYTNMGIVRAEAPFGYGEETVNNVLAVQRQTASPINAVRLIGQSGGTDASGNPLPALTSVVKDETSQGKYGVWWSQQSFPDIVEQSTLDARAEATLRPEPIRVVGFTPDSKRAPKPWDDFWIGDTVPLSIRRGAFVDELELRVNGIDITIDENGVEGYTLTVEQR